MLHYKQLLDTDIIDIESFLDDIKCQKIPKVEKLECLKKMLQSAITLEFATIPAYLCALWSIKDEIHPVAKSIREIVQEEMLHMSFACNMLTAIGGTPVINKPGYYPVYPGKLPGGVHPDLLVGLQGLTKESVHAFMVIELPEKVVEVSGKTFACEEATPKTVGDLYSAILQHFQELNPVIYPERQITGPLSMFVVDDPRKIKFAIDIIRRQGEGSNDNSPYDSGPDDLAHFYRFWEVLEERKIKPKGKKFIFNEDFPFPDCWPMAMVPPGGYLNTGNKTVDDLLLKFDQTYTAMINTLQSAWQEGGQAQFIHALELMFKLEEFAKPLMQIEKPNGSGTYGPCFRILN